MQYCIRFINFFSRLRGAKAPSAHMLRCQSENVRQTLAMGFLPVCEARAMHFTDNKMFCKSKYSHEHRELQ